MSIPSQRHATPITLPIHAWGVVIQGVYMDASPFTKGGYTLVLLLLFSNIYLFLEGGVLVCEGAS